VAAAGEDVLIRLLALVGVAVALAGCGGSSDATLDDAAEATAGETSRFEMNVRYSGPSTKGVGGLEASGAFDYPNKLAAMTVSGHFPFLGEDVAVKEVRLIGRTTYIRWVVKGKQYWVKDEAPETSSDPSELLIPLPGSPTKPTDVLERVLAASDDVAVLGTEDVRGVETTHYRARVDLEKVPSGEQPEDDLELGRDPFVPVELWIDDESRLRRITITRAENQDEERTSVELFDYGVQVDVEPVPAEELTSQEEFDKLLDPLLELESGVAPAESGEGEVIMPAEVCTSPPKELPKAEADRLCRELKEQE
jgi:LppX_LprAFG lipoprotein